ncbi:MAG: hypothetical protein ACREIS_02925 [Nitrospiraceae bacterium]
MRVSFALLLLLAACGPAEVRRDVVSTVPETWTRGCSRAGFCCAYGLGFNGKWEFSCGMKMTCPGNQTVFGERVTERVLYEDGSDLVFERLRASSYGNCQ